MMRCPPRKCVNCDRWMLEATRRIDYWGRQGWYYVCYRCKWLHFWYD